MIINEDLLKIYAKGFNDELEENLKIDFKEEIERRAYNLGRSHAIIGDDVRSVDYLTSKEILNLIKSTV